MKHIIDILDQLIWKSELDDRVEESKDRRLVRNTDGWTSYHLKVLKEEIEKEFNNAKDKG